MKKQQNIWGYLLIAISLTYGAVVLSEKDMTFMWLEAKVQLGIVEYEFFELYEDFRDLEEKQIYAQQEAAAWRDSVTSLQRKVSIYQKEEQIRKTAESLHFNGHDWSVDADERTFSNHKQGMRLVFAKKPTSPEVPFVLSIDTDEEHVICSSLHKTIFNAWITRAARQLLEERKPKRKSRRRTKQI